MALPDFRKALRSGALALSLAVLAGAAPALAQETGDAGGTTAQTEENGQDWGWIGLLGLAGLAGLMRRDRNRDHVEHRTRP